MTPLDQDYILVRCSRELVRQLVHEPEAVVLLGVTEREDGTYEMTVRNPDHADLLDLMGKFDDRLNRLAHQSYRAMVDAE